MKRRIKRSQFDNLDAMRFLAFLAIFLSSAIYTNNPLVKGTNFYNDTSEFMSNIAQVAMSLAFILTSFLNTWAIFEERFIYKKLNLIRFYMRRLLTIVPLYLLIFVLGYFLLPKIELGLESENLPIVNAGSYLSFLTNYSEFNIREPLSAVLGNMWSIAAHVQFLIVWPLLLRLFRRNEKFLFAFTLIIFAVSAYFNASNPNFRFSFLNILCDITIGGYLAYVSFYKYKLYQKLKTVTPRTIGTVYILFIISFLVYNRIWKYDFGINEQFVFIIKRIAYGLTLAFFIFEQNFANKSVFKLTKLRIFDVPGQNVYGLYVYHAFGLIVAIKIAEFLNFSESLSAFLLIPFFGLLCTFILNAFSREFFENRFIKLKKNYQPTREYTPVVLTNENKTKPA